MNNSNPASKAKSDLNQSAFNLGGPVFKPVVTHPFVPNVIGNREDMEIDSK